MSQTLVNLSNIPQGWYMSWTMSTQTAQQVCVTLSDSSTTYIDNKCRTGASFGKLSEGYMSVQGTGLTLTINEPNNTKTLQTLVNAYSVPLANGNIVGQGYNILLEDALDQDYNDLFVSIIAWKSNG